MQDGSSQIKTQYFPERNDYVIRVGDTMVVNWESKDISDVNIYFVKNELKMFLDKHQSIDGNNMQEIVINNTMFSEEYYDCYILVENRDDRNIIAMTRKFKVMRQQ